MDTGYESFQYFINFSQKCLGNSELKDFNNNLGRLHDFYHFSYKYNLFFFAANDIF